MSDRLPPPPTALSSLQDGDLRILGPSESIGRIYFRGGPHPAAWNTFRVQGSVARFDHHRPVRRVPTADPDRAIAYWAISQRNVDALTVCLAEIFQTTRVIDRSRNRPAFAIVNPLQPLHLLDLSSLWIARNGADQTINSGPHARSQQWSEAIHAQYPEVDGLLYPSSVASPGLSIALFERAAHKLGAPKHVSKRLDDEGLTEAIELGADTLGYGLEF